MVNNKELFRHVNTVFNPNNEQPFPVVIINKNIYNPHPFNINDVIYVINSEVYTLYYQYPIVGNIFGQTGLISKNDCIDLIDFRNNLIDNIV